MYYVPKGTQNGPAQAKIHLNQQIFTPILFPLDSLDQNLQIDIKNMFVIHVQAELLLFEVQGVPKIHKILNPRKSQNIDRRTKKFWICE